MLKIRLLKKITALLALFLFLPQVLTLAETEAGPFFSKQAPELTAQKEFKALGRDFSGITVIPETGTYLVVDDRCKIIEMAVAGTEITPIRTVRIQGLEDCEAIAYMGLNPSGELKIAVTEERRGRMACFPVGAQNKTVDAARLGTTYHVASVRNGWMHSNSGLEAMAVDRGEAVKPVYYFAKEEYPKKIFRGRIQDGVLAVSIPWDAEAVLPKKGDIADLFFYEGSLFVLDERQATVRQVNPETGSIISEFRLPPSKGKKYEGLALRSLSGGVHEMVVVAEENQVTVFRLGNRKA